MLATGSTLQPQEFEKSPFRAGESLLGLLLGLRLLGLGLGSWRGSLRLSGLDSRRGSLGLSRVGLGGLGSSRGTLLRLGVVLLLGLCRRNATFLGVAAARSHFSGWKEEEEVRERRS